MELESGIEKVQVLKGKGREGKGKGKGKEREGKAGTRQGQGKAGKRQGREMSKDRTKERTKLAGKKRKEVVLARILSLKRELRVNHI